MNAPATSFSHSLSAAALARLELLLAGYFAPLHGYFGDADVISVAATGRLADGRLMPALVCLDVAPTVAAAVPVGATVGLRDAEGVLLAELQVESVWSSETLPPATQQLLRDAGHDYPAFLAGPVRRVEMPAHYDFVPLRLDPGELAQQFVKRGWRKVLACQPESIIHRAEAARIVHAARVAQANVLVQALATEAATMTPDHYTRIRCLEHGLRYLPERSAILALMPGVRIPASPHGVLWRATIARNAGATHLLVDPHWWGSDEATLSQVDATRLAREAGIELVNLPRFSRDAALGAYLPGEFAPGAGPEASHDDTVEVIRRVRSGQAVPEWLSFPEVVDELRLSHPVRGRQGVTIFFTGLSGAGKSTIARVLLARLLELGDRTVTLLDGDVVRKNLSSELGFSREHRNLNILRIGYVASEISKHGGIAVCAPIAPYRETRRKVRDMVEAHGGFLEVHVATPLATCESRDRKGLYAKARAGIVKEFTGISDPYETPERAELVIDTRDCAPLEAAQMIITRLESDGYIG